MRGRVAAAALALPLAAACTFGPEHRAPSLPPHAAGPYASASPAVDPSREAPDAWWRLYDDATLSVLVAEALAANTDLRAALANVTLARSVMQEARAGRYPSTQLSAGAIYGRNTIGNSIAGVLHANAENQYTYLAGVDVAYEVDLSGRVTRSIEAAEADAQGAEAARDALRVAIVAETTRAYAAAGSEAHELEVARRSLQIAEQEVAIVERQRKAGAASDFDIARVRTVADQARAQLPAFEGRRRAALLQLAVLLGRVPAEAPKEAARLSLALPPPVGDGAQLLARRPDVRQAERRLAAASARIGVATASLYPRVSFGASFGFATNQVLKGSNALTVGVGPLVSWTFPNQAAARARIAESEAASVAALANFDGTVLRALGEVERAITACDAETTRRAALASAESNASRAFDLARSRRREGVLSQLDLLAAEQTLISARAALAASDSRIVDAQISLFKALGGGWRE